MASNDEYDSEDEDFKRAIALSLGQEPVSQLGSSATSPRHGDEDGKLKEAIAMSLQTGPTNDHQQRPETKDDGAGEPNTGSSSSQSALSKSVPAPQVTTRGIPGLDRKTMEAERLARQSLKRKADPRSDAISPPPTKRTYQTSQNTTSPVIAQTLQSSRTNTARSTKSPPRISSSSSSSSSSTLAPQYPHGAVKQTWALGHPRTSSDIKIEEVLQPRHLQLAVLSAFQWNMDWLLAKLERPRTKVICVMQGKEESTRARFHADAAATQPNLRICFPPMPGTVNCMHSKLMLLGYENFLRVVVPSANLMPYDWGETGVMENSLFLIDLPRRDKGLCTEDELGLFGRELVRFCRAKTLDEKIVKSLYEFDWIETQGIAFIHSIGGEHTSMPDQIGDEDAAWRHTGLSGLGRAVTELGLQTTTEVEVDFVASSIGSLNDDFVTSLYLACQGDDGTTEYNWRTNAANIVQHAAQKSQGLINARSKAPDADTSGRAQTVANAKSNFRLFFPSKETVHNSTGGPASGGTICFNAKWYNGPKFPKQLMRDCISRRSGLLMHNKMIFVRHKQESSTNNDTPNPKSQAWAYVGSANCSESAWGKLTFNKTSKMTKLTCRNWECGVLLPVSRFTTDTTGVHGHGGAADDNGVDSLGRIFAGVVPVPMEWPGDGISGKEPWYFGGFR